MKTPADIIALQRVIRDLQRERKRLRTPMPDAFEFGRDQGFGISLERLRARIKRLRARAAKGEGT